MYSLILYTGISVIVVLFVLRRIIKLWLWGSIDKSNEINIKGKTVLITGASAGIGLAVAFEFACRDANVILACRDIVKAKKCINNIRTKTHRGQLIEMQLDLSSLNSVKDFAKEFNSKYDKLDILILNAGVMFPPQEKKKTKEGFEIHFGVNHLGHFLLTNLLLEPLKKAAPSRIVTVSSLAHSWGSLNFDDLMSEKKGTGKDFFMVSGLYANSKLANALFSKELGKRLNGTGVRTFALCPGFVITDIGNNLKVPFIMHLIGPILRYLLKSPKEGASTILYCALSKNVAHESGEMYQHCKYWDSKTRIELKDEDATKLWDISQRLVGL